MDLSRKKHCWGIHKFVVILSLLALSCAASAESIRSSAGLWSTDAAINARPSPTYDVDKPLPQGGSFRYVSLSPIFFDYDEHQLSPNARMSLDAAVAYLKNNHNNIKRILIEGFADIRDTQDFNDDLSGNRAKVVRAYLLFHGIDARLITVTANGKRTPTDINWTPLGRARNRQVAIHAVQWQFNLN